MRFRIETLGCKVNQYESQQIRQVLLSLGYIEASIDEPADLTIVNTCTVTHRSDSDARKILRKAYSSGSVIATGCLASTRPEEISRISGKIKIVSKDDIGKVLGAPLPKAISVPPDRTRAFVKIQDGCSNFCTFCIVPYARGCPVSRPAAEIIGEINCLYGEGCKEIVLCGINLGLYEGGLTAILERILNETLIPRIRISSIEPWTVKRDFMRIFTEPRVCAHLHLPLQSGSAKILRMMGRPYNPTYFRTLIDEVLSLRPETAIGTDIMAGFPGENDEDFEEGLCFLKDLPLAYMHVFPFSIRPGTKAAGLDGQVSEEVKKERAMVLRRLSENKRSEFAGRMIGQVSGVLVTASANGMCKGITPNYIKVVFDGNAAVGDIVKIRLEEVRGNQMKGVSCG